MVRFGAGLPPAETAGDTSFCAWHKLIVLLLAGTCGMAQPARWEQLSASEKQLYKAGKYTDAGPVAQEAVRAAEGAFGAESQQVASSLSDLGLLDIESAKYAEAEAAFSKALAIDAKLRGAESAAAAVDLGNLGEALTKEGKFLEADPAFRRSLAAVQKSFPPDSLETCRIFTQLAGLLDSEGRYAEAFTAYNQALQTTSRKIGPQTAEVAGIVNDMGGLILHKGQLAEAAAYYRAALAIREKTLGPNHPKTGETVQGLGFALMNLGRIGEAAKDYTRAVGIYRQALGQNDLRVGQVEQAFGELLRGAGDLDQAFPMLVHGERIIEVALGPNHLQVADALIPIGECYEARRQYADAESAFHKAFEIRQKALGPAHPAVAKTLAYAAGLYRVQGRFADADGLYQRALSGLEQALGPDHPDTAQATLDVAANYFAWDKPDQAAPLFDRGMDSLTRRLASGAAYMSERDRLDFLSSAPDAYPLYYSFVYAYRERKPELAGKMYDLLLAERGFAASSAAALRAKIFATGDKQALDLFDQLGAKKMRLAAMTAAPQGDAEAWRKNVSQLQQEANDIEENLARRSVALKESKAEAGVTWRDVQKALQPGEAAVEYVRFDVDDGKGRTSRDNYAALVLTREGAPKLIAVGDAIADETPVRDLYNVQSGATRGVKILQTAPAGAAAAPVTKPDAYNAFWKPLEPALAGAKRVYVASDGILNQFPIGLFPDGAGSYLMEKYDIRQLNSTKDLLRSAAPAQSKTAVLMGNPNFELTEAGQRAALAKIGGGGATAGAQGPAGSTAEATPANLASGAGASDSGKLPPLPGTQAEVEAIAKTFQTAGWQVTMLTGDLALEEALMRQRGPRVLHIATHGFFLSGQQLQNQAGHGAMHVNDPMLNSGLFFAGANRALSGAGAAGGLEDGVLTSAEATQLDLAGSELVVLSACETGRGQQQNGEGVFGLRRALEEAGASAVLMSMWPVPDRETQELMTLFYGKWLGGADKHDALRQAQFEERAVVRQRYGKDLPFYWGAFVLVGR